MRRIATLCAALLPLLALATETEHTDFRIFRAPGPIAIDGAIDDWDLTGSMLICSDVENYRDQYASWQCALYDDDNLYLLSRWIDKTPLNNPGIVGADNGFAGDCLQVRIMIDSTGVAQDRETPTEKLCHVDAWRGRDGRDVVSASVGRRFDKPGYKNMLELGARQAFAMAEDGSGYTQEISIPWKLLAPDGYLPKEGDTLLMTYEPNFGTASRMRISTKDLFRPNVTPDRVFAFRAYTSWGSIRLLGASDRSPMPVRLSDGRTFPVTLDDAGLPQVDWNGLYVENKLEGFEKIGLDVPEDGFVSMVIRDSNGFVVRNLLNAEFLTKGPHEVLWDGLTHPGGRSYGEPVPAGRYTWEAIWRKALDLTLVGWAANAGSAPYDCPGGNWGGDQGNPNAAVCDGRRVVLGWTGSEAGKAVVCVNYDGRVQWRHKRGGFGGASLLALSGGSLYVYDAGQGNTVYRLDAAKGEYQNYQGRETALLEVAPLLEPYAPKSEDGTPAKIELSGMAAAKGRLFLSAGPSRARWHSAQPSADIVLVLDAASGDKLGEIPVANPGCLSLGADGRLYLLADGGVSAIDPETLALTPVLAGLGGDARSVTADADGAVYVGFGGDIRQIRVYDATGKAVRSIGREGGRALLGPWQKDGFFAIAGMCIDAKGRLWVTECDDKPRRVTMWDAATGELLREFFGPTHYGAGGGAICPSDPRVMVGLNCEWKLDPDTGLAECVAVISRDAWASARFGEGPGGRVYLAVGGGRSGRVVDIFERVGPARWMRRAQLSRPTGEEGNANRPPSGFRVWSDRNGDQQEQPDEVAERLIPDINGWIDGWYMPMNQAMTFGGGNYVIAVTGWTACGAPEYDLDRLERLPDAAVEASQYRGGMGAQRCLISKDGRYVIYNAHYGRDDSDMPCFEIATGRKVSAYPSNYVGVHGGHRAPPAKQGMIRGAYDFVGTFQMPEPLGSVFVIGTDKGEWHIVNAAGYYVGRLFEGDPMKIRWPDEAIPGANMNTVPPGMGAEDFGGSVIQADSGEIYVQAGKTAFIAMRLDGLETCRLLGGGEIDISDEDVLAAQDFKVRYLSAVESSKVCSVPAKAGIEFTGNPDKDFGEPAAKFGERGALRAWIAVDGDRLCLAWRADDPTPWVNGASSFENLYAMGDTVDFQLATRPDAKRSRGEAGEGDLRLSIGNWRGTDTAVLYRKVSGEKAPMTFVSGVWRDGYTMDYVKVVRDAEIRHDVFPRKNGYVVEAAIPLAALGFTPSSGLELKGDFGFTFGDPAGTDTNLRVYWANQATGIVADEVAELMMQPSLWGTLKFE